jgi:hypothetical protein
VATAGGNRDCGAHVLRGEPERRLMFAVLRDAIARVLRPGLRFKRRSSQLVWKELAWFRSCDFSAPFSFVSICEALGLDPGRLRRNVFRCVSDECDRSGDDRGRGAQQKARPRASSR